MAPRAVESVQGPCRSRRALAVATDRGMVRPVEADPYLPGAALAAGPLNREVRTADVVDRNLAAIGRAGVGRRPPISKVRRRRLHWPRRQPGRPLRAGRPGACAAG